MDNRRRTTAFQSELTNILNDLIYDNNRNQSYSSNQNTLIIQSLRESMQIYSENFREYTTTVRIYLQIIELLLRQEQIPLENTRRSTNRTRSSEQSPLPRRQNRNRPTQLSYLIYSLNDLSGNLIRPNRFQDVTVRPSQEQINRATTLFNYSRDLILTNHSCPILLEDFEEGEPIRRIINCGHSFCEESIQNWFQTNVRCPVCRYDIRDTPPTTNNNTTIIGEPPYIQSQNQQINNLNFETDIQSITNNMIQGFSDNITNILNDYVNNPEPENDLIYSFEFPIIYRNDLSGNPI
jgi:hypothetical protein